MKRTSNTRRSRYSEQILPVPWPFAISRFHSYCELSRLQDLINKPARVKLEPPCTMTLHWKIDLRSTWLQGDWFKSLFSKSFETGFLLSQIELAPATCATQWGDNKLPHKKVLLTTLIRLSNPLFGRCECTSNHSAVKEWLFILWQ